MSRNKHRQQVQEQEQKQEQLPISSPVEQLQFIGRCAVIPIFFLVFTLPEMVPLWAIIIAGIHVGVDGCYTLSKIAAATLVESTVWTRPRLFSSKE